MYNDVPSIEETSNSNVIAAFNEHLKQYLETPPAGKSSVRVRAHKCLPSVGFDPHVFAAAQANNPNPEKYLPVPVRGFEELKQRCSHQMAKREQQKLVLEVRLHLILKS